MYLPEHTHIPVSRRTPPPTGDAELADEYKRTLDPFVALAMAAAVTDTILLGTGICLVAQREPIVTAKTVATLDQLSRRALRPRHRVRLERRRDRAPRDRRCRTGGTSTREHMLAMRALWNDDAAEFHGAHVDFSPSWSWPKPLPRVGAGGSPVLIGGAAGPKLFAHIAEYADGWIPIGGRGIRDALPELHAACEAVGRDPARLRIVPFGTIPEAGKLEYYASLGIEEIVLRVPSGDADTVLPLLDRYAELAALPA